jgi:hypothetical protein
MIVNATWSAGFVVSPLAVLFLFDDDCERHVDRKKVYFVFFYSNPSQK